MRPVTPAIFMRLPARMKNGTASSGKLSTPAIMRCASVTSGVMPVTRIYTSDDTAMASATGRPTSISSKNPPRSSSIGSAFRSVECARALQDGVAPPPVLDRDLDRAHKHHREAEQHGIIDEAFLKLDRRHPLVADDLDELPDQLDRVADKDHADQAVGRNLLGPGVAVVEDVAGEELQEDAQRHDPEDRERQPVFHR